MLTPEEKFNQYLQYQKLRLTPPRKKFLDFMFSRHDHIPLEEITGWCENNGISRATQFRTLALLADAGMIEKISGQNGRTYYEHIYQHNKHHHIICLDCGKIIETEDVVGEKLCEDLCRRSGFQYQYAILNIYCLCDACLD